MKMPSDDLTTHASSDKDYYALLGITFETAESDIRRAYRTTALKCHPDKNPGDLAAAEKFHLVQIAYDVLSDPTAKALYDNVRRAKREKEERNAQFEGRRRAMKDDLERRESGFFKRQREEDDDEEKLRREERRIADDNRTRLHEYKMRMSRERLEEEERLENEKERNGHSGDVPPVKRPKGGTEVDEQLRSVKVRWVKEGALKTLSEDALSGLFCRFGKVESTIVSKKEKRQRLGDRKDKVLVATGIVVFASVVGAYDAVEKAKKQSDFEGFESVSWASGQEPEILQQMRPSAPIGESSVKDKSATPEPPQRYSMPMTAPSTPLKINSNGHGLKKVPSFSNFSAAKNTPGNTPKAAGSGFSLDEMTMLRLKNAEKRRLEEQIRKQEEAEEATKD
jgi:DnaJ family protein C protein 17